MAAHPPSLPTFLTQTKAQLHAKFIDLEWQQRNRLLQGTQQNSTTSPTAPSPWARMTGDHIAAKNRYLNVEPYAANRVKLKGVPEEQDYINASPIVLGERRYIATQGPKDTGVGGFYRMLLQECGREDAEGRLQPAVVVMLTQTHEAGREKCFQYYPLSAEESPLVIPEEDVDAVNGGEEQFGGDVELESVEANESARCEVRRMRLRVRNGGEREMEIRHLLFSGWPDFLIPEGADRAALVKLVELSNQLNSSPRTNGAAHTNGSHALRRPSPPRIIHCSAGVGRSGTFIALDYLLSELYAGGLDRLGKDRDPIAETVDLLRQQRMMMVQGESQFMFLYEIMREMWEERASGEGR